MRSEIEQLHADRKILKDSVTFNYPEKYRTFTMFDDILKKGNSTTNHTDNNCTQTTTLTRTIPKQPYRQQLHQNNHTDNSCTQTTTPTTTTTATTFVDNGSVTFNYPEI